MEGLRAAVANIEDPASRTMIIREHVRAPQEIGAQVADIAMERGFKIKFDARNSPFVPSLPANAESPAQE